MNDEPEVEEIIGEPESVEDKHHCSDKERFDRVRKRLETAINEADEGLDQALQEAGGELRDFVGTAKDELADWGQQMKEGLERISRRVADLFEDEEATVNEAEAEVKVEDDEAEPSSE